MAQISVTPPNSPKSYVVEADNFPQAKEMVDRIIAGEKDRATPITWENAPGQFLTHAGTSAINASKDLYGLVRHPLDTAKAIRDTVSGAAMSIPGAEEFDRSMSGPGGLSSPEGLAADLETKKQFSGLVQHMKDRWYGDQNAAHTLVQDPAGAALDVSGLASLGAGVTRAIPGMAKDAATLSRIGSATNPASLVAKITGRAITPFDIPPERQAAASGLMKEGIIPSAGQITGSRAISGLENTTATAQNAELTKAALSRFGVDSELASPEVLNKIGTDIGGRFDKLASRNSIAPNNMTLENAAGQTYLDYADMTGATEKPLVHKFAQEIMDKAKSGMTGEEYKSLATQLREKIRASKSDSELRGALTDLQHHLDDAMERDIGVNNPKDLGGWKRVRGDYRNLLVLDRAMSASGPETNLGRLTPQSFEAAVKNNFGKTSYARGRGDYVDLAHNSSALLTEPPPPNPLVTRMRQGAVNTAIPVGTALGAAAAGGYIDPIAATLGSLVAGGVGATIPSIVRKLVNSEKGQAYLKNTILSPKARGIIDAVTQGAGAARLAQPPGYRDR
jgi:hypothetical protein